MLFWHVSTEKMKIWLLRHTVFCVLELFGYANPYRMLGLCQQIADIQGEILTINVPFPEVFYYKM